MDWFISAGGFHRFPTIVYVREIGPPRWGFVSMRGRDPGRWPGLTWDHPIRGLGMVWVDGNVETEVLRIVFRPTNGIGQFFGLFLHTSTARFPLRPIRFRSPKVQMS